MQVTRIVEGIDYGHCLQKHNGYCHNLHGHRATIRVTAEGVIQKHGSEDGMVIDFGVLKTIIMSEVHAKLDHGFAVELEDPRCDIIRSVQPAGKLLIMDGPPTAETLAVWAWTEIETCLPWNITLVEVVWYETPNNYATFNGDYTKLNQHEERPS